MAANHLYAALFAATSPDAVAIETPERRYTYADLDLETARFANALTALGVAPGDRVAAQVEKSAANLLLYLATIRAGAVFLPLNPAYTLAEAQAFLADAEPALVVCDPSAREAVAATGAAAVETLDAAGSGSLAALAAGSPDRFATAARTADDLAAICYTSGTTGRSKGAMLTHAALAANAAALRDLWRFTSDDVLIHALPLYHVHGLFVAANVLMMAGGSMILQPRFDPAAVIAAMGRATSLMGVPTFYHRLLASPELDAAATARMRLFVCGSAPLLARTHEAWRARTGHAIIERYGMTETLMIASNPYDGERRPGTVGFALPGVSLRIAGEVGAIEVKGTHVFGGYWRAPEKTAAELTPDGWFVTGDLGRVDADGYLSIVGRAKDLVISGGLNIYPKEIEAAIDALPGVVESAVIGLPHADLGEAVTAVVVASGDVSEAEVLEGLTGRLARFKIPRRVVFAHELPRNGMGKVQKATLRDRYRAAP